MKYVMWGIELESLLSPIDLSYLQLLRFSIMEKWSQKLTPLQGPKIRKMEREAREARNADQSQED